jgi:hypothetical protein
VTGGFLVVRRDGVLWGLPAGEVAGIERSGSVVPGAEASTSPLPPPAKREFELRLTRGGRFGVDAVLTLASQLDVRPLSRRLRRFLPHGSNGLAMVAGEPMLMMTPAGEDSHD